VPLVSSIMNVAINHDFPILLGKTIKSLMDKGIKIPEEEYVKFYMYLDRCKGLEKDTLRFIFAVNETSHIQINWDFVKPLFSRAINFKQGSEILEMFEQIKAKLVLNKTNQGLPEETQKAMLNDLKMDYYRGLIDLLLEKSAHNISQVIYDEYRKEMNINTANDLPGLKLSAADNDIVAFEMYLNEILSGVPIESTKAKPKTKAEEKTKTSSNAKMTSETAEKVGYMISKFKSEDNMKKVTAMAYSLVLKMKKEKIKITEKLFKTFVNLFTSQQINLLIDVLQIVDPKEMQIDRKTLQYIRENMIYIADQNVRISQSIGNFSYI